MNIQLLTLEAFHSPVSAKYQSLQLCGPTNIKKSHFEEISNQLSSTNCNCQRQTFCSPSPSSCMKPTEVSHLCRVDRKSSSIYVDVMCCNIWLNYYFSALCCTKVKFGLLGKNDGRPFPTLSTHYAQSTRVLM